MTSGRPGLSIGRRQRSWGWLPSVGSAVERGGGGGATNSGVLGRGSRFVVHLRTFWRLVPLSQSKSRHVVVDIYPFASVEPRVGVPTSTSGNRSRKWLRFPRRVPGKVARGRRRQSRAWRRGYKSDSKGFGG